jgi:hypothetical protein
MGKLIRVSYDVVTPESAAEGDTAETGWDCEEGYQIEADETESHVDCAVRLLAYEGADACYASASDFHTGVWYQDGGSTDYRTGAVRTRAFHLDGFTVAEEYQIWVALGGRPLRSVPRCSTCGGQTHPGLPCNPSEATNALLDALDGTSAYYARRKGAK